MPRRARAVLRAGTTTRCAPDVDSENRADASSASGLNAYIGWSSASSPDCRLYARASAAGSSTRSAIISYLNGRKVGGIMFWAVNEGARAPNGKTTGENSVALANYAAAL